VESTILIDVWTVEPELQEELVQAIEANVENLAVGHAGFVSAEVFQSANRDMVVLVLRMRDAHDRQTLTDSPELQAAYRSLRQIATSHRHLFRLARSFGAPSPAPAE
jgi:hypothetical protein